jgi:4-hydroxy-tetrahydrodipicolinate synthase
MLKGLYVPCYSAFHKSGAVNYKATVEHGSWLISQGVNGLVPFGIFGEGASLSFSERCQLTLGLIDIRGTAEIIPTVISNSFGEILDFFKFIEGMPISAVMVIPPSYYRPIPDSSLIDFYKRLSEKTEHKIIAYNIPSSSIRISPMVLSQIPVWGVKDSSGDLDSARAFLATGRNLLIGSDPLLSKSVALGAMGGVVGVGNLFPRQMVRVCELSLMGDLIAAEALLQRVLQIILQLVGPSAGMNRMIGTLKKIAQLRGPPSVGDMRYPLPEFSISSRAKAIFANSCALLESD